MCTQQANKTQVMQTLKILGILLRISLPELALKLVRFPDPSPKASLPQLASMDEHSSCSKNVEDTFKRQSRETSRGTPMSVLLPPEESEHSSTKAHSVILKSSATHPEVKTIEPCSSNQISKPTSQYSDDKDDSQTETLHDALSRVELFQTLRKSATGKAEKRAKTEAELAAARAEWEMNAEPNWRYLSPSSYAIYTKKVL